MRREEFDRLLGGYATGNLTGEERRALLEAALEDQEFFDELVREQAFADLLEEPAARTRLLEALDRPARWDHLWNWMRRPAVLALAGSAAAALIAVALFVPRAKHPAAKPVEIAEMRKEPEAPPPAAVQPPVRRKIPLPPRIVEAMPPQVAGGVVGGVVGGVPGGMTMAAPPPPPPPPARKETARDMGVTDEFRQSAPRPMVARTAAKATQAPDLRYTVLRETPEGAFAPAPETDLRTGDSIRLNFETGSPGNLTVLQGEATGGWRLVFSQAVEAGRTYAVPAVGSFRYEQPGAKEFQAVLSRAEAPEVRQRIVLQIR